MIPAHEPKAALPIDHARRRTRALVAGAVLAGAGLLGTSAQVGAAPGQSIALEVVGPSMNPGKVRRCEDVARRQGYTLSPQAPVRVTLHLNVGSNRLVVTSARRGQVLDAPRPGWGMEQLCEEAMQTAERALLAEGQAPLAQAASPPPVATPPSAAPPPQPRAAAQGAAPGGAPSIALDVTGPDANPGKHERCLRVAHKRGFVVTPASSVRVTLVLQSGLNRLQINSQRRGEVLNQQKPGWGMEQLCEDAMAQAALALASEGDASLHSMAQRGAAAPPPGVAPRVGRPAPRGFALGPIPPGADLPPAAKAAADRAVVAWQSARFDQAVAAFREAGQIQNDPQFLFDQAVCEQRLGLGAEALQHVQQFIARAPQSPYRPYADQLVGELQGAQDE